jgi:hypothetical protein
MTNAPNDDAELKPDPDGNLDIAVTLTVAGVSALLTRADLEPDIAAALRTALEKQHPTTDVMGAQVRRVLGRKYGPRTGGAA